MGARANLKAFKIVSGDVSLFIYIIVGVIAAALLVFLIIFLKNSYKKYKMRKEEKELFFRICSKRRLTQEEIEFILGISAKYGVRQFVFLVRSMRVFDRYIAREVAEYHDAETKIKDRFKIFVFELRKKLGFANFDNLEELTSTRAVSEGSRANITITIANMEKKFEGKITVVDEEGILVSVPDHFIQEEPIRSGQTVTLRIAHHEDAIYDFKTNVYKVVPGPPGYIALEHTRTFSRSQRRKYPRLDVRITCQYFPLDHFHIKEFNERRTVTVKRDQHMIEGIISNISGGGCYFNSPVEYDQGKLLWFSLDLENSGEEFKDIVGRVERVIDVSEEEFRIIVQFVKIKDTVRDRIVHYIHNEKTKRRQAQKLQKVSKMKEVKQ